MRNMQHKGSPFADHVLHHLLGSCHLAKVVGGPCAVSGQACGTSVAAAKVGVKEGDSGHAAGTTIAAVEQTQGADATGLVLECVPASYLRGKYVLLYVTDPMGSSSVTSKMLVTSQACGASGLASVLESHSAPPSSSCPPQMSTVSTERASSQVTELSNTMRPPANSSSRRVALLLSKFCNFLTRWLAVCGRYEPPVAVLEVRHHFNAVQSCGHRFPDRPQSATAFSEGPATKAEASFCSTRGFQLPWDDSVLSDDSFLTLVNGGGPYFGGWFCLESSQIYRRSIRLFSITSWPAVLLFDTFGRLLSPRALDHIEQEVSIFEAMHSCRPTRPVGVKKTTLLERNDVGVCGTAEGPAVGNDTSAYKSHKDDNQTAAFSSKFPWFPCGVPGNDPAAVQTGPGTVPQAPLDVMLRNLISRSRHVSTLQNPSYATEGDVACDENDTRLFGSHQVGPCYLLLCFGSSWDPSSHRLLSRLKRLCATSLDSVSCEGESDVDKALNFDETNSCAAASEVLHALSLNASHLTHSASLFSVNQETKDALRGATWLLEREATCQSSRFSTPHTLSGSSTCEHVANKTSMADPPLSPSFEAGPQATAGCKFFTPPELLRLPYNFQVLYVGCDSSEEQWKSTLTALPGWWLCISPALDPGCRVIVEACTEFFDVRTLPRLIVICVSPDFMRLDPSAEGLSNNSPSTVFAKVIQLHGERSVDHGDGLGAILNPGIDNDVADATECLEDEHASDMQLPTNRVPERPHFPPLFRIKSIINSLVAEGGTLFVLCAFGRVAESLHTSCITALRDAAACWFHEAGCEVHGSTSGTGLSPSLTENTDSWGSTEAGAVHSNQAGTEEQSVVQVSMRSATRVDLRVHNSIRQPSPLSKMYIVDAIMDGSDSHEAVEETADNAWGSIAQLPLEEKALFQEYVVSEVLESSELLPPPLHGEPFLVSVQWPGRRVDVLRRRRETETSLAAPTGSAPTTRPPPAFVSNPTAVCATIPLPDHRLSDGVPETSVEAHETCPLRSVDALKAFIVRHCPVQAR
uniref:Uncharacterized protein n=1 Tax=Trypanosoma vivax (strain Y486) TaxID=1055687 RepID=G0TT50_TRYVY|nr:conserved hypothetical protein [Trypanosoma vivax Y486]